MYCINCGRPIEPNHSYCAVCGAYQHPNKTEVNEEGSKFLRDNEKALAIISYIGVLSLVSYFVAPKDSRYARFHAVQGLNLFIIECIYGVAQGIVSRVFNRIWFLESTVSIALSIVGVGILILAILGIVHASKGEMVELPVLNSLKIVKE